MSFDYTIRGKHCSNAIEIEIEIGGVNNNEAIEILGLREVRLMQPTRSGELDTITLSVESMTSRDERYWTGVARDLLDNVPEYRVRETVEVATAQRRGEFDPVRDPIADRRGNWPVDKSIKIGCSGRCSRVGV